MYYLETDTESKSYDNQKGNFICEIAKSTEDGSIDVHTKKGEISLQFLQTFNAPFEKLSTY